tara:strand:- start:169 stop:285 length:117 start_codon:yes stop_codon:yes gene_type:complete
MSIDNKIYTNNLKLIFGDFIKELQAMQKESLKNKTTNK